MDPKEIVHTIYTDIEKAFNEVIHAPWQHPHLSNWVPNADIYEDKENYYAIIDLPGIEPNQIDLKVHKHQIVICGKREEEIEFRTRQKYKLERSKGKFCRTIDLPKQIDSQAVVVKYNLGTCELKIKKK